MASKASAGITAKQFNAALDQLGWTTADFAAFIGASRQTAWRWSKGDLDLPLWAWRLIETLLLVPPSKRPKPDQGE